MPLTLDDAKTVVRDLTGERGNTLGFVAGLVLLAPMIEGGSFDVDGILRAIKNSYSRNRVEKCVANFLRNEVWSTDDTWNAEWPALFVEDFDTMADDRFLELQMSFVLDVLIGEGRIVRYVDEDKKFLYQSVE